MRILIFSDTHGQINRCLSVIDRVGKVDMILHAGDYVDDAEDLAAVYPHIPLHYVAGNNDLFSNAPHELIINAGGKRIIVIHGHVQRVKTEPSYATLIKYAKSKDVDMVVFGHTHISHLENAGNLTVCNPGSIRYMSTYAVCDIEDGVIKVSICNGDEQ